MHERYFLLLCVVTIGESAIVWATWIEWGMWSSCSVSCGPGVRYRTRRCRHAPGCVGPDSEASICNSGPSPTWIEWGMWSSCSVSCGAGERTRTRTCIFDNNFELCRASGCEGPDSQTSICNSEPCLTWGAWGMWSTCNVSCGAGVRNRTRKCFSGTLRDPSNCSFILGGHHSEMWSCNREPCLEFGLWSSWTGCSRTCGKGTNRRSRACMKASCDQAEIEEILSCNTQNCSREFGKWSDWKACSRTCGGGTQDRSRECLKSECDETEILETQNCITQNCPKRLLGGSILSLWGTKNAPRDCIWGPWTGTDCIQKGENEYRILRTREKIPAKGGEDCEGDDTKEQKCKISDFVGTTFLTSFTQISVPSLTAPAPSHPRDEESCRSEHRDGSGNLRMLGNTCRRTRRAAVSPSAENKPRSRRKREEGFRHRDILFIIDESGSVGEDNFKTEMSFAKALISKFCGIISVGNEKTRIAMITFDSEVRVHFNFDSYFRRSDLLKKVNEISFNHTTSGSTCLVDALNFTQAKMFTAAHGARNNVDRAAILITDGCANCDKDSLSLVSAELIKQEITTTGFIIDNDGDCMVNMEDLMDGSQCYQLFRENWDEFRATIYGMQEQDWCFDRWQRSAQGACLVAR